MADTCGQCTYDCCPIGHIAVLKDGTAAATFSLSEAGQADPGVDKAGNPAPRPQCDTAAFIKANSAIGLRLRPDTDGITASGTFVATLPDGEGASKLQQMTVTLRDGFVAFANTGTSAPRVCDGETAKTALTVQAAVDQNLVSAAALKAAAEEADASSSGGGGMSGAGQFFLVVFILGLIGAGGFAGYRYHRHGPDGLRLHAMSSAKKPDQFSSSAVRAAPARPQQPPVVRAAPGRPPPPSTAALANASGNVDDRNSLIDSEA